MSILFSKHVRNTQALRNIFLSCIFCWKPFLSQNRLKPFESFWAKIHHEFWSMLKHLKQTDTRHCSTGSDTCDSPCRPDTCDSTRRNPCSSPGSPRCYQQQHMSRSSRTTCTSHAGHVRMRSTKHAEVMERIGKGQVLKQNYKDTVTLKLPFMLGTT